MTESNPIVFENKDGYKLFGILHEPDRSIRKLTAIILLSPGIKMRVAPHGMYKKMADCFVQMGFPVLRFDFYGLGDAEGDIDLKQLSNVYNSIQLGRYVDDVTSSMDWMEKEHGISRFIVGGLCGGAITGMLAAQNDMRACALLALGIPVALDVGAENWHKNISQGQLKQLGGGYIKNMFKPKSWLRLLSFQSDYRVIWKSIKQLLFKKYNKKIVQADKIDHENDNTNPKFSPALLRMLETSRPMIHIFSGADRLAWEFEEKFKVFHSSELEQYGSLFEEHVIDKANHILAHPEWFDEMLMLSQKWLVRFK